MKPPEPLVRVYDSCGEQYRGAFQEFLDHTDQKDKALTWLENQIACLSKGGVLVDAGAGNGRLTRLLAPRFRQVIAIEPNPSLREELQKTCPSAVVLPTNIIEAEPAARADFVLSSHVFYYIARSQWLANLEKMASWLQPTGVLVIAIQNRDTDCMRMLSHFTGHAFDLREALTQVGARPQADLDVRIDTVAAEIRTTELSSAYVIAEFMLNLLPLSAPPQRAELEHYIQQHFRHAAGGYRFSCDQDFLCLTRRSSDR